MQTIVEAAHRPRSETVIPIQEESINDGNDHAEEENNEVIANTIINGESGKESAATLKSIDNQKP